MHGRNTIKVKLDLTLPQLWKMEVNRHVNIELIQNIRVHQVLTQRGGFVDVVRDDVH